MKIFRNLIGLLMHILSLSSTKTLLNICYKRKLIDSTWASHCQICTLKNPTLNFSIAYLPKLKVSCIQSAPYCPPFTAQRAFWEIVVINSSYQQCLFKFNHKLQNLVGPAGRPYVLCLLVAPAGTFVHCFSYCSK
jgi:hypothetical protein